MNNFTCSFTTITKNSSKIYLIVYIIKKGDRNREGIKLSLMSCCGFYLKIVQVYLWITFLYSTSLLFRSVVFLEIIISSKSFIWNINIVNFIYCIQLSSIKSKDILQHQLLSGSR